MALQLVQGAENMARSTGNTRLATVLHDIQDYHATTRDLQRLVDEADIGQLALYHLVPAPRNAMGVAAFNRGIPDGAIITEDGMVISLPSGTEDMTIE
jgi:ribonuclease BN (tRNA processing enzyme)